MYVVGGGGGGGRCVVGIGIVLSCVLGLDGVVVLIIHGIGKDLVGSGRWKMYGRVIDLLKQMFNLLNNRYNLSPLPYIP